MAYDELTAIRVRLALSDPAWAGREKNDGRAVLHGGRRHVLCGQRQRRAFLVRVGPSAYERTLKAPHVQPMHMRGRTMRGFVRVAPEAYKTDAALKKWIRRGLDFVATLPARPRKKPSRFKQPGGRTVQRRTSRA